MDQLRWWLKELISHKRENKMYQLSSKLQKRYLDWRVHIRHLYAQSKPLAQWAWTLHWRRTRDCAVPGTDVLSHHNPCRATHWTCSLYNEWQLEIYSGSIIFFGWPHCMTASNWNDKALLYATHLRAADWRDDHDAFVDGLSFMSVVRRSRSFCISFSEAQFFYFFFTFNSILFV